MAAMSVRNLFHQLRSLAVDELCDRQLLHRFTATADEAAFATLVRRHGPLVLGVCRRGLGAGPDSEDALPAAFLVLPPQAASLPRKTALARWPFVLAHRPAVCLATPP